MCYLKCICLPILGGVVDVLERISLNVLEDVVVERASSRLMRLLVEAQRMPERRCLLSPSTCHLIVFGSPACFCFSDNVNDVAGGSWSRTII